MADNITRYNQVQMELYSDSFGALTIQEPKGWENDTRGYARDKVSRGITYKTEVSLEFYGNAKDYLTQVFKSKGVEEKVLLTKFERDENSLSEDWKLRYVQELDMGTFKEKTTDNSCTIKATQGGLYDDITKRRSTKFNLINTESADGVDIGVLKTYRFLPQVRGIFLESRLEDAQTGYRVNSESYKGSLKPLIPNPVFPHIPPFIPQVPNYDPSPSKTTRTIPLDAVYLSDPENMVAPFNTDDSQNDLIHDQNYNIGTPQHEGDMFYFRSDIDRAITVKAKLTFKIESIDHIRSENEAMYVELRRMEHIGDEDLLMDWDATTQRKILLTINNPISEIGNTFTIPDFEEKIDLLEGQSLSLVFVTTTELGNGLQHGHFDVYNNVMVSELVVEDETPYAQTESRCIKPFDLFERLIAKITGKTGLFKSTIFGVGGKYENMVVDNGFWARGFPDVVTEDGEDREIQLNTSFKDAFAAYNYLEPLTWFTEIVGKQEVIRIEEATYTMQNFTGLSLDAVDNISHEASKPDFFSDIKIGHTKSLEYEEVNGLNEPNGLSEFNTHISRNTSLYSATSEYRFDAVRYELTRRLQYRNYPYEDTKADEDIFMHDAKWNGAYFTHIVWTDDVTNGGFDSAPTGIFDPDTAWNLNLSPMNRLFYGHSYSIKRGLYHYPKNFIRFSSSNANQNVKTVKNGIVLYERGNILIDDIPKPRVEAEKTTMTFKITQSIEDQLLGVTKVNNDFVPNYFGLIEYIENGEKRYGRINKLTTDKESKLELQNARL